MKYQGILLHIVMCLFRNTTIRFIGFLDARALNIQGGESRFIQLNISFPAISQVLNERDNYGGNEKTCV